MAPWGGRHVCERRVKDWAHTQWNSHVPAARERGSTTHASLREVCHSYGGLVWHCADHKHTAFMGYLSKLYARLLEKKKTLFETPDVFVVEDTTIADAHVAICTLLLKSVRTFCAWAFRKECPQLLPSGYCFPKEKKGYTSARPVIPFAGYFLQRLHRGVGIALADVTKDVLGNFKFSSPSTQSAIGTLRRFAKTSSEKLGEQGDGAAITSINEDIASFFIAPLAADCCGPRNGSWTCTSAVALATLGEPRSYSPSSLASLGESPSAVRLVAWLG